VKLKCSTVALFLILGCGVHPARPFWKVEVLLPDVIAKSSLRTDRFAAIAGTLVVSVRKGQIVKCKTEVEYHSRTEPSLDECDLSTQDFSSYWISVVLKEKGKTRQLASAQARLRPADYAKEDRISLKLNLSVPVREFDVQPE
jgi:hypothetical protein